MQNDIKITKKDIEEMKILTSEEIAKLSFHELCAYLKTLEVAENILKEGE